MAKASFDTGNQTLRQLIGNGLRYAIPPFQRDYSWTQDEWDGLWQDMQDSFSSGDESAHYMGYLVLQTKDRTQFWVVDGQQRLTTFSLLALAVLKALQDLVDAGREPDDNARRIEQLRNTYIGYLDPVTLISQPKLTLNRRNNSFFQNYIVPLAKFPKARLRSDELMRKAFEYFYSKIKEKFKENQMGGKLAEFLDDVTRRLFFTVITVDDELNAFRVFETLNARGVRLSPTDLLKNYLFSVVHKSEPDQNEIDSLEKRWEEITERLGEESFPDFLRIHWNSRNARVRESALFKTIREKTPDKSSVFALLRNMDEDVETFAALSSPESEVWNQDQKRHVRDLRLFNVRQPRSLLLAARRAMPDDDFTHVLRACVIVSFRYNIIAGRSTGDQETVYTGLARDISEGRITRIGDFWPGLKAVYPSDAEFAAAFASKSFKTTGGRSKAIATYVLFKLENTYGRNLDPGSAKYNLEHVLPKNPENNWPQFSRIEAQDMVDRIGNCAILETSLNREVGDKNFEEKKAVFEKSEVLSTRSIAWDNNDWDAGRIAPRQQQMARNATSVWRIKQLG